MVPQEINAIRNGQKLINAFFDLFAAVADISQADKPVILLVEAGKFKALEQRFMGPVDITDDESFHMLGDRFGPPAMILHAFDQDFSDLDGVEGCPLAEII